MEGVRYVLHLFLKSEDGVEASADSIFFNEPPTEEMVRKFIEGGTQAIESVMNKPMRPMTDEEIEAYLEKREQAEFGQLNADDMPFSTEEEAL